MKGMIMSSTRRTFLKTAALGSAALAFPFGNNLPKVLGEESQRAYKVGICDWNVNGYAANPECFAVAKALGFQGVQVSYALGGQYALSKKENRPLFREAAEKAEMQFASLAMGLLNDRAFVKEADAEEWVSDCLDAMESLGSEQRPCDQVLLAFFGNGDLKGKPDDHKVVIEKLKRLAPKAEKLKKVLAIETYLSAEDHVKIIDAVGSDAVKIYYDIQNALNMGYNIFEEMPWLGKKKLITQVHLKDDNKRLENSAIDLKRVRKTLDEIGYFDWLVVESAVEGDWKESQAANAQFVRKLFDIQA